MQITIDYSLIEKAAGRLSRSFPSDFDNAHMAPFLIDFINHMLLSPRLDDAYRIFLRDNRFPANTRDSTMKKHGWGFVLAPDAGAGSGEGFFYACPWHRDDVDDAARIDAIDKYNVASKK